MQALDRQSTILTFEALRSPPTIYHLTFRGLGIWRMKSGELALRDVHQVSVELAAAYPRLIPNLSWQTPIFHPNISSSGIVCLGGYGTNWVPSLSLDELCNMLWDMIRYKNFDTESPYNKDAAIWAKSQTQFAFPLDNRSLRDLVGRDRGQGESVEIVPAPIRNAQPPPVLPASGQQSNARREIAQVPVEDIQIVEVIDQSSTLNREGESVVSGQDIMFID